MITKRRLLFFFGILIILNSILFGLPFVYESFLNIILGLFVIVVAFLLGRDKADRHHPHHPGRLHHKTHKREQVSDVFTENNPQDESNTNASEQIQI